MYPNVYNYLIDKLKENNIHSFDVQMTARKIDSSVEIYVCFGERFTREVTRTVSEKSLSEPDNTFKEFCEEIKEKCKETRSEEHTSEIQSRFDLVCRLLL